MSAILDKTLAQCTECKIDLAVLLAGRLALDTFRPTRQIQIAAEFTKNTVARLAGREVPCFKDIERSVPELQDRIARTLASVDGVPGHEIDGSEQQIIMLTIAGKAITFRGQPYLLHFTLPDFYFHRATAYAIPSHNGIELGKRDFLGAMPGP